MKNLERHLTLLCDFYQLTMARGYFHTDFRDRYAYFDVFFRKIPDEGGFAICAGLEQIVDYIKNLYFDESDIDYLRSKGIFDKEFLDYLKDFRFRGDIWAIPEGTVIFPGEPVITVRAKVIFRYAVVDKRSVAKRCRSFVAKVAKHIIS